MWPCRHLLRHACGVRQYRPQHRQHLRAGLRSEPAADSCHVVLDGLGRDEQLTADVAVRHAQQQQFGDLAFAVGQPRRLLAGGARRRGGRRGRLAARSVVDGGVSFRSRASCSIAPDTRPSGVCSAAWPANRVASQVSPNWESARAAAVTSSTSTWLANTRSHVRPAPASAFAKVLLAEAAVRAWPCGATASGEFARIPAWTPAQCSGTDHNTGSPNDVSRANASSRLCCSRST